MKDSRQIFLDTAPIIYYLQRRVRMKVLYSNRHMGTV